MTKKSANDNLSIWDRVEATDPAYTKEFKKGGGFSGTSINAQYNIKKATEVFGPNGIGWGVNILDEKYMEGKPLEKVDHVVICREIIHILKVNVWYMLDGEKHETSPQFGQTTFVGSNKYGSFTDEEAPKKTMTDAMNKCLALLGFGGDIFLGMYDDNKYVNDKKEHFVQEKKVEQEKAKANDPNVIWAKEFSQNLKAVNTLEELANLKADNADTFKKVALENKPLARQISTTIQSITKRLEAAANDDFPGDFPEGRPEDQAQGASKNG